MTDCRFSRRLSLDKTCISVTTENRKPQQINNEKHIEIASSTLQSIELMRPLTEEETKVLFLKLSEYIGKSIERLIDRSDERHCFRIAAKDRVYYVSESVMKASNSISRDAILSFGTCLGKFSKSGKFRLHVTALDYLSQYAQVRCVLSHSLSKSL